MASGNIIEIPDNAWDDDDFYDDNDMMEMENLFGSCDIEKKLYMNCLRKEKTERNKGFKKYWFPEWTVTKDKCRKEAQELDLCTLKCQWRIKIVEAKCRKKQIKFAVSCFTFYIISRNIIDVILDEFNEK